MSTHDPIRNPLGPNVTEEQRLRARDDRRRTTFELALNLVDQAADRRPVVRDGSIADFMGFKGLGTETRIRLAASLALWLMGEDNAFVAAIAEADKLVDEALQEDQPDPSNALGHYTALRRIATEATNLINAVHPAMDLDVTALAEARNAAYAALDWPLHGRLPEDAGT